MNEEVLIKEARFKIVFKAFMMRIEREKRCKVAPTLDFGKFLILPHYFSYQRNF